MGIGKIVASVTRRAAYQIKAQCPEEIELLSLPALLAGDANERALIQDHPSIIIDGCALRCAAHIYRLFGVEPAAKVEVNQIMKEKKIGPGKTRKELEEVGKRLSSFTADRVLEALRDEGVNADYAAPDELSQPPPETGCGCPHRGLAEAKSVAELTQTAVRADSSNDAAIAEAAETTGVCQSGPAGEQTADGKHLVKSVTILPCQGIKRTGGRITQRAAYHVVEDRFLGQTQLLCISALAAGVQEDVDMLEKFPTIAINGCGLRCASVAAEHHGIPAAASVDLQIIDPVFNCEEYCLEPDLTEKEAGEALKLADAVSIEMERMLGKEIEWREGKIDLHGLIHEPGKINGMTGFRDGGKGFLVKLAEQQLAKDAVAKAPAAAPAAAVIATPATPVSSEKVTEDSGDFPGLKNVVATLFKPKNKNS